MKDENCIFCKLANGIIPTNSIYEDENFNVILDAGPATKGHALIYELPEDTAAEVFKLAKKMAVTMTQKLNADGFNIVQNNEEVAGQSVFHFHMHLIPRYKGDGQHILWKPTEPTQEELKAVRDSLI